MSLENFMAVGGFLIMNEMAVFNKGMAEELVARGFKLVGRSKLAWFFEDSALLEEAISELVKRQEELGK